MDTTDSTAARARQLRDACDMASSMAAQATEAGRHAEATVLQATAQRAWRRLVALCPAAALAS